MFGHTAYYSWLPEDVVKSLTRAAQSTSDIPLVLRELSFARYDTSHGIEPSLFPHSDETFREPRITFDLQLKSNLDWPIVVEGKPYVLSDNQALTFSGTHQIHWREHIKFNDDNFMDMIFCHFSAADYVPESLGALMLGKDSSFLSDHDNEMIERREYWNNIYYSDK